MTKTKILAGTILFIIFFSVYFITCIRLNQAGAFVEFDTLFEIDPPRVIDDMAKFDGNHARTIVHPLYVLMVNPVGLLITIITGSADLSAFIINSALGALGVVLAFVFFAHQGLENLDSFLLAVFFGLTTSHYFLSSVPDTATLAICSLIITYLLFAHTLKTKKIWFFGWFLAGVFSLGVTTTNFAQTMICLFVAAYFTGQKKIFPALQESIKIGFLVLTTVAILALLQKWIYPSSLHFLSFQDYDKELSYASTLVFRNPRLIIVHQIKKFLMTNIVAPNPVFFSVHGRSNPMLTFGTSHNFEIIGWIVLWTYLVLQLYSWLRIIQKKDHIPFYIGIILCLFFNFLFHAFYGVMESRIELFLYTGNLTFLTIIPLGYVFSTKNKSLIRLLLIGLIFLIAINNICVMEKIITTYTHS